MFLTHDLNKKFVRVFDDEMRAGSATKLLHVIYTVAQLMDFTFYDSNYWVAVKRKKRDCSYLC